MPYEYQITRRVEFAETDMAGLMHFSNFFRYMEVAEHAFFRSLGHSVVLSRSGFGLHLPRVHARCDYRMPLYFEDEVRIHLLVQKKGTRSLTYQFRFHRLNGPSPQAVARGELTIVCAERRQDGTLKAAPLPKVIADKIQQAPAGILAGEPPAKAKRTLSSARKKPLRKKL